MDAKNRWWVAELKAADCEKAWIHARWEDATQKKDEKEKMEEMHQQKVEQMIKSAEGSHHGGERSTDFGEKKRM